MKNLHLHILIAISVFLVTSLESVAKNTVTFDDMEYTLDSSTILLDAEGVFGSSMAYKDARDAFDKVNEIGTDVTLLIAPSVYWIDDPDDPAVRTDKDGTPFGIRIKCDHLRMIGLSHNPEDVVLAANRGQTQGAVGNFTMFHFSGNHLDTENITFGNYCNIDLSYPRKPSLNRKRRKDAIVQAQIGICGNTDKLYAKNCRFLSRLNLCPFVGARRSLYENCYFESTDDALSGSAIYLDCRFLFCSSKPFYTTDKTGAVFLNCDITSLCDGTQYFTKVPGQVTAIDTRFHGADSLEIDWTRDPSDVKCFQHNVSLNGKPYVIDAGRPELWISLDSSKLLDAYLVNFDGKVFYNLPNLLNGPDNWDPKGMNQVVAQAEKVLGRKLTGIPVSMEIHADKTRLAAQNDTVHAVASPLLWGWFPAEGAENRIFVSDNSDPVEKNEILTFSMPNGLSATQTVTMLPYLKDAPSLQHAPRVNYDADKKSYVVDYLLDGHGTDDSSIYWARIARNGNDSTLLLLKRGKPAVANSYSPVMGDFGSEIVAIVHPKFYDSLEGEGVMSIPQSVDMLHLVADAPESFLHTDFSDIPVVGKSSGLTSAWSFDVYKPLDTSHVTNWKAADGPGWYYGKGFDASVSEGLVQSERGARMSYVPTRDSCRNMSADIIVEPAKSGGQGFGSATAQYMDICLKFDPIALDGYALRIERTPDFDKAVRFSLIRYDKGNTSVIDQGVVSNCYRTACSIHAEIRDGILSATASTDAHPQPLADGVVDKVSLSAPVEESSLSGFCIQHTGSTGPSSSLIKDLVLKWE